MRSLDGLKVTFLAATLGHGGAERQLFYILRALRRAGALPRLIAFTQGEFWEGPIRELGVPVVTLPDGSPLARLHGLVRALRQDRPDVLQSQHFHANLYAVVAARVLGLREIGAIRNDAVSEVRNVGGRMGRWSLLAPRVVAANSRAAIQNAVALGAKPRRLVLLPNVLDTERFAPPPQRPPKPVRVLLVGRLHPDKRVDRFISIVAKLRERTKIPFQAIIVGHGPDRANLEEQAACLGLSRDWMEFRGAAADVVPAYQQASVLVLTSQREGTPNVVLEAMACGLPVVATSVGGVPEIVQHGETGFLAGAEDENEMIEPLLELVQDAALRNRMGLLARAHIEEHYSMERLPAYLVNLYQAAL
jgi:glycosyltransferase involved in cell wall biosynthesis